MEALIEAGWRVYPAGAIVAGGVTFAIFGVRRGMRRARGLADPRRALELMVGFRLAVVGLAVAGFGVAWMWSIGWLGALSAIIGGEELLESSFVIATVRNGPETTGVGVGDRGRTAQGRLVPGARKPAGDC